MTVVSLLNSGADVQTENEVYIVTCPDLYPINHHVAFLTVRFGLNTSDSGIIIRGSIGLVT